MDFLTQWGLDTWAMVLDAAPWLVIGFMAAGVLHVLLPAERLVQHLGRSGISSVFKASLVGIPLPLCSCSVIPVASSIRKRGASKGATASFLVSTPESGVDSIAISYALLGPVFAIVRPIAAFITAMTAGGLITAFEKARGEEAKLDQTPAAAEAGGHSCCHGGPVASEAAPERPGVGSCCGAGSGADRQGGQSPSTFSRVREAARYGLVDMFVDLGHLLVIGFVLGGLISTLVPQSMLERVGSGPLALIVMAFAGLPMYVCATAATPLAAALIAKGLSPGAALVFLLVGPATNVATMLIVGRDIGRRSLAIYLGSIAVVAIVLGSVVDALPMSIWQFGDLHPHAHGAGFWSWIAAIVLVGLIVNGLRLRYRSKSDPEPVPAAG